MCDKKKGKKKYAKEIFERQVTSQVTQGTFYNSAFLGADGGI